MVPSSCHAISQLVGHTCAWRRVQISVWKSEEAVKRCKSLNEACAGLVPGAASGHCSRHQSGGYIDGDKAGTRVRKHSYIALCINSTFYMKYIS